MNGERMANTNQEFLEKTPPSDRQNQDEEMPLPHPSLLLMQAIGQIRIAVLKLDTLLSHPQICEGMLSEKQKLDAIRGSENHLSHKLL